MSAIKRSIFRHWKPAAARRDFAPGKPVVMRFEIDEKNVARVAVKGENTSVANLDRPPPGEDAGAVGILVRSGTLVIERLDVQDR